jgi:MFS family permease
MSVSTGTISLFILFFMYGIYGAATEGISKAWLTNLVAKKDTATAIGTYTAFQSICTMLASSLTGILWYSYGATFAFALTAVAAILVLIYFMKVPAPEA